MSLARLVVTAVRIGGRPQAVVPRDYGVSRRWVHELVRRFDAEGEAGLQPRSRRPQASPHRILDASSRTRSSLCPRRSSTRGWTPAPTRRFHLIRRHGSAPAVSTIWRVLSRRGFVTPQPQKRPKSSFVRFEAEMPNERWQADITHWKIAGGTDVEILNVIDDHSRLLVASDARAVFKAADVVGTFHRAAAAHGFPAQLLTDNGAVFTAAPRGGGRCAIELEADRLGISLRHSSPYHPQTCGKVERLHQALKRWLAKQPLADSVQNCRISSIGSASLTTATVPTGRSADGPRPRPTPLGRRHRRAAFGSRATAVFAVTGSTPAARCASSRQQAAPHQGRSPACRDAGADARRRSLGADRDRGRRAASRAVLDPGRSYQPLGRP